MDFYAILGISTDADADAIRNAYRTLVRRYHPDAGPGSCPQQFRHVVEAYETLRDPARRQAYDLTLRRPHFAQATPEPMVRFGAPQSVRGWEVRYQGLPNRGGGLAEFLLRVEEDLLLWDPFWPW